MATVRVAFPGARAGGLTFPRGETMALLPLEPQPAAFLLSAEGEGCLDHALTLAAGLSVQSPFSHLKPSDHAVCRAPFAVYEGDALTLLNVCRAFDKQMRRRGERAASKWCKKRMIDERVITRIRQVRGQLSRHLDAHKKRQEQAVGAAADGRPPKAAAGGGGGGGTTGTDHIRRALIGGYFANAARHEGGGFYRSVLRDSPLKLHVNSVLYGAPPDWIIFHETVYSTEELVLSATKVRPAGRARMAL